MVQKYSGEYGWNDLFSQPVQLAERWTAEVKYMIDVLTALMQNNH